jgi:hypothetical protein
MIELHSVPCQQARAGLQDIELARISQEVTERFYSKIASLDHFVGAQHKASRYYALEWLRGRSAVGDGEDHWGIGGNVASAVD